MSGIPKSTGRSGQIGASGRIAPGFGIAIWAVSLTQTSNVGATALRTVAAVAAPIAANAGRCHRPVGNRPVGKTMISARRALTVAEPAQPLTQAIARSYRATRPDASATGSNVGEVDM